MTLSMSILILIKRLQHDTTAVVAIDRLAAVGGSFRSLPLRMTRRPTAADRTRKILPSSHGATPDVTACGMGTREVNRRNAKKSPGLLPQNGRSPGGIQKDELHPSQLTKGEAHKNLAVKRPTAMVAGRGMGTTATIGTAAAAAATAEIAQYGS